jgi:ABC-2 type transport system permease protein
MFIAMKNTFIDEIQSIKNSTYKLLLISVFPLLSFFLLVAIFYEGVLQDLPIVVVDNDKSALSRELIRTINDTKTLKIAFKQESVKKASQLIQETKAYALVIIPPHFQRDTILKKQPQVTAMINTQYILLGKIIKSSLNTAFGTATMRVQYMQTLSKKPLIGLQITPFFNTYQNYFLFLVSALLPSVWQIFIVIATIVSFGELIKKEKYLSSFKENTFAKIIGKLLPYTLAYMLLGVLYTWYIYGTLGWSFEGSFFILFFGMFLTIVAYQAVALFLFVSGFDYARTLSLGAVYTAPAFAFLGVTFPIYNMNGFALFWRDILPISHFIELQISQANYGLSLYYELDKLLILFSFWVLFLPVYLRFRQRVKNEF